MKWLPAALIAGALIRAAALPLPGTGDVGVWRNWAYSGAVDNPASLYGIGGSPPIWRTLRFNNTETQIVYPPLTPYELAVVGRLYKAFNSDSFPDGAALTIAVKALAVLFEVGFALLLWFSIRSRTGISEARWATVAYWLNPAAILCVSVLGYLEPLFVLPAAGAIVAATGTNPFVAGGLIAAATLTKPQALVLVPGVALAVASGAGPRKARALVRAGAGGLLASIVILAPIAAVGALPNMIAALARLARHDMLSGNACNLWWIVGYVTRVVYAFRDMGTWPAVTMRTRILGISRFMELGYPNPRVIGAILTIAALAWAIWTARRARGLFLMAGLGAFLVHAYATLAAQVHENHLFASVPLLVMAAAGRPRYRPVLWVVTAIFALNLNLFYGISEAQYTGRFAIPRSITIIDLTVLLAVANCAALGWHALVLRRECRDLSDALS